MVNCEQRQRHHDRSSGFISDVESSGSFGHHIHTHTHSYPFIHTQTHTIQISESQHSGIPTSGTKGAPWEPRAPRSGERSAIGAVDVGTPTVPERMKAAPDVPMRLNDRPTHWGWKPTGTTSERGHRSVAPTGRVQGISAVANSGEHGRARMRSGELG